MRREILAIRKRNRTILIVEDEPNLGFTLREYLKDKGYNVHLAQNTEMAFELFITNPPAIVLMDIGLPDGNGLDLCKRLRSIRKDFVLIFLSAQNDPEIRVKGLELGGEDYITKPFALKELILRLERILKSDENFQEFPEIVKIGNLVMKLNQYELIDAQGNIIALTQKEKGILQLLYDKRNQPVTREEIIKEIWGPNSFPSNRTVDNYIVKLRKWVDSDPLHYLDIKSIRGIGYKLSSVHQREAQHGNI